MKNKTGAALGAWIAFIMFAGSGTAGAQSMASLPGNSIPAAVTGDARPVLAWVEFCQRHPQECGVDAAETPVISLTPRIWQQIVSVNRRVNTGLRAVTATAVPYYAWANRGAAPMRVWLPLAR